MLINNQVHLNLLWLISISSSPQEQSCSVAIPIPAPRGQSWDKIHGSALSLALLLPKTKAGDVNSEFSPPGSASAPAAAQPSTPGCSSCSPVDWLWQLKGTDRVFWSWSRNPMCRSISCAFKHCLVSQPKSFCKCHLSPEGKAPAA